jgi:2-methylisocitrate lyase-like PEP mutase family enzyme
LKVKEQDESLLEHVIERGKAFADAGASGFFVPRLADSRQIE